MEGHAGAEVLQLALQVGLFTRRTFGHPVGAQRGVGLQPPRLHWTPDLDDESRGTLRAVDYGAHDTAAAAFMSASGFPFTLSGPEATSSIVGASVPPSLMCPAW